MMVAIDCTSRIAFAKLHGSCIRRVAEDFLRRLIDTVLTDIGTHFTDPTGGGWTPSDIKRMLATNGRFQCHFSKLPTRRTLLTTASPSLATLGPNAALAASFNPEYQQTLVRSSNHGDWPNRG